MTIGTFLLTYLIYALILYLIIFLGNREYREWTFRRQKILQEIQEAWNEYCKDMSYNERYEVFFEWCDAYRVDHDLCTTYYPNMNAMPYTKFDRIVLDGKYYLGTIEEIAKESGWPEDILYEITHRKYEPK